MRTTNWIIGNPLNHTLSPVLHNEMYRQLGVEAGMVAMADSDVEKLVNQIREQGIGLTAVTIPHKETILQHLDEIDSVAQKIGAVNTVINDDGKLTGYNTDIVGVKEALRGIDLNKKNVLLLGAGGAARPVAYHVQETGGLLYCANRTSQKAQRLVGDFGGQEVSISEIEPKDMDVIVNSTPVGMSRTVDQLPLPQGFVRTHHIVFDLIYNPLETKLLRDAEEIGARVIPGLDMFIAQGVEQERLWLSREIHADNFKEVIVKLLKC